MKLWMATVGAAALWTCAVGSPARAAVVPSAQGSPYAVAKAGCARQGKTMSLVSNQTNDASLASDGIAVTFECVARPVKAAVKPGAGKRRAVPRPR